MLSSRRTRLGKYYCKRKYRIATQESGSGWTLRLHEWLPQHGLGLGGGGLDEEGAAPHGLGVQGTDHRRAPEQQRGEA